MYPFYEAIYLPGLHRLRHFLRDFYKSVRAGMLALL